MDCNVEINERLKNRMSWNDFWSRYSDQVEDDAYRQCLDNGYDTDTDSDSMRDAREECADYFIKENNLDVSDDYPDAE